MLTETLPVAEAYGRAGPLVDGSVDELAREADAAATILDRSLEISDEATREVEILGRRTENLVDRRNLPRVNKALAGET